MMTLFLFAAAVATAPAPAPATAPVPATSAPTQPGKPAKVAPSPSPSASPSAAASPSETYDPNKPGEVTAQLKTKVQSLKGLSFDERIKRLDEIKTWIEKEERAGKDEAISYMVSLEPIFVKTTELKDPKVCAEARSRILFLFESGTGYDGKLPYFVPESLSLLAAICGDQKLTELNPKN